MQCVLRVLYSRDRASHSTDSFSTLAQSHFFHAKKTRVCFSSHNLSQYRPSNVIQVRLLRHLVGVFVYRATRTGIVHIQLATGENGRRKRGTGMCSVSCERE